MRSLSLNNMNLLCALESNLSTAKLTGLCSYCCQKYLQNEQWAQKCCSLILPQLSNVFSLEPRLSVNAPATVRQGRHLKSVHISLDPACFTKIT